MDNPKPTFKDLVKDKNFASACAQLNKILNYHPPTKWLEDNPNAKDNKGKPLKYLPIDKVEYLLNKYFGVYDLTIEKWEYLEKTKSCVVHVRLKVKHPFIENHIVTVDGIGASEGNPAVAFPAAKSYALKDAADHLGRKFGKDLNRINLIPLAEFEQEEEIWTENEKDHREILLLLADCKTLKDLDEFEKQNKDKIDYRYAQKRRAEIKKALKKVG